MSVLDPLGLATEAQRRATTPDHSAWVEANAGTNSSLALISLTLPPSPSPLACQ